MAALTGNIVYRNAPKGEGLRYIVIEVKSATSADTYTVSEWTKVKDVVCIEVDTGAELACTEATNVITIGGAVTTVPLAIMTSGW